LRGQIELDGERLAAGDGAAITDVREVAVRAAAPAEVMLFDLA